VTTQSHLFSPDLENDETHITLRDNPNHNVTLLSSHTRTLSRAAASQTKLSLQHPHMTKKKLTYCCNEEALWPLALNSQNKESIHNLKIPVKTEFSDMHHLTDGKQRLLFNFSDTIIQK
jgi:hypothetical protein